MRLYLFPVLAGFALLLTACPHASPKPKLNVIRPPAGTAGGPASAQANKDTAPGQGAAKPGNGAGLVELGSQGEVPLPEGWPEALPAYPGATIKMGQRIGSGTTAALNVVMETKDAASDVLRFYDEKAKAAGFTNALQVNTNGGGGMYRYESATQAFAVTATAGVAGTATAITLVLSQK
jgi:hypothetical protein